MSSTFSVPIAIEGVKLLDGRTIEPGALYLEDIAIPVFYPNIGGELVGSAGALSRADDGTVRMVVEFLPEHRALRQISFNAGFQIDPYEMDGDTVKSGRLRAVILSHKFDF